MSKIILITNDEMEVLVKNNISHKNVNIFEPKEISDYVSQALERCVFDIIEKTSL